MTIRLWRASEEAEFGRETRAEVHELEQQEREDAEHREPAMTDWWEDSAA